MIATDRHQSYLYAVALARFIRVLTLLAIIVAPFGMIGMHGASATIPMSGMSEHHAAMQAGHGMQDDERSTEHPGPSIDCAIACAAIPSAPASILASAPPAAPVQSSAVAAGLGGLHPESEPPPPRS